MKTIEDIKAILFDESESECRIVKRFTSILEDKIFIQYKDENNLIHHLNSLQRGGYSPKEVIILKKYQGRSFQLCPGSQNMICCNYRIINTSFNCIYNCTYCYLNSYLNSFGIMQLTNIEGVYREINDFLKKTHTDRIYRIGTGEFTDSLMIDETTGIGRDLIERMSPFKNVMFELKTKSNNIDHLLNIKERGNAVLAWSLNTERNILRYEKYTAPLLERIEAAKKADEADFYLAFHFDPIIIYNGWEDDYKNTIDLLFKSIDPEKVVWISLGCFRYSPGFKDILRGKFPNEDLTIEEMFPGLDGKFRYLKKKRIEIYRKMKEYINHHTDKPFLYLCMENSEIWNSIFNKYYSSSEELERDFNEHLKINFLSSQ